VARRRAVATECGHTAMLGELHTYLRRAGYSEPRPTGVPEPWASTMEGHGPAAMAAWQALGETYEEAVVAALHGSAPARAAGLRTLTDLGAHATLAALTPPSTSR
jgi:hypothetical protein